MNKGTIAGATALLFLMIAALAGCAKRHVTFEKPGAAAADVQRDTNECLISAMRSEGGTILAPRVDHDALVQCMEARGYRIGSK